MEEDGVNCSFIMAANTALEEERFEYSTQTGLSPTSISSLSRASKTAGPTAAPVLRLLSASTGL